MTENKYDVKHEVIGQYEISTLQSSPFVLFNDSLNGHKIYIPKRIVNEMYHLIQSNWQEENQYLETYRSIE